MKPQTLWFWIGRALLGLGVLVFLLMLVPSHTRLAGGLEVLPLGWLHFLTRNLPQLTFNWSLIGTGLICSLLIILLSNGLFRTLFRHFQQPSPGGCPARRWPWRWTLCMYGCLWLLFVIAFGASGVLRHTQWLMEYPQPWYERRMHSHLELWRADRCLQELLIDEQDLEARRKAFASQKSYSGRQVLLADEFNVLFYGDTSNRVAACVIIPRDPRLVAQGRFGLSVPGTNCQVKPFAELHQTIAELDVQYGSGNKTP